MTSQYLLLFAGILCAALGGEWFVKGSVGLARWARIPAGIIGASIAAFATSSPELTVAITSARAGTPEISLGDALGSNVVNVSLILAIVVLFGEISAKREVIRRDFRFALIQPLLLAALAIDGTLSALDGCILLAVFFVWLVTISIEALRERKAAVELLASRDRVKAVVYSILGLVSLLAAGKLIVVSAKEIAVAWGASEFVIGAIVVALGTSTPELATAVISRIRGHDEVGLGTVLGSNIFNGLFIVGVASLIHPIRAGAVAVSISLIFGVIAILASYPNRRESIERWRGGLLLCLYAGYVLATLYS